MISIMEQNKNKLLAIIFWLVIWQIVSTIINEEILLVSPFTVLIRVLQLLWEPKLYLAVYTSLGRILSGFVFALICGIVLAILSDKYESVKDLLAPFIFAIKSVPIASFIILVLIWVSSAYISVVISFVMVFPILYENIRKGIGATDRKLLEMADVYGVSAFHKIKYIYFPSILPFVQSAGSLAIGLSFKAGIAAEIIGMPNNTIGEYLYKSKIYFNTADLFAWTLIIIFLSVFMEKIFMFVLNKAVKGLESEE